MDLMGLHEAWQSVDELVMKLNHNFHLSVEKKKADLKRLEEVLRALDPGRVLNRGYSYVEATDGHVVASAKDFKKVPAGRKLTLHFQDGKGTVIKEQE
jgi:exodeoxyribonuclease VII large subunit